jgi:hypothetical protein
VLKNCTKTLAAPHMALIILFNYNLTGMDIDIGKSPQYNIYIKSGCGNFALNSAP